MSDTSKSRSAVRCGGGGAVYGLGLIGAVVYYWQHAHGFWPTSGPSAKPSCGRPSWFITCSVTSRPELAPSHRRPPPPAGGRALPLLAARAAPPAWPAKGALGGAQRGYAGG